MYAKILGAQKNETVTGIFVGEELLSLTKVEHTFLPLIDISTWWLAFLSHLAGTPTHIQTMFTLHHHNNYDYTENNALGRMVNLLGLSYKTLGTCSLKPLPNFLFTCFMLHSLCLSVSISVFLVGKNFLDILCDFLDIF